MTDDGTETVVPEETVRRTLTVPAEPESVDRVLDLLNEVWRDVPGIGATDRLHFETAVMEIASNIVKHACDGSAAGFSGEVIVRADRLEAHFRDSGEPGEVDLERVAMPDELAESGRGLALALSAADQLVYQREGSVNHWQIVRHRRLGGS